MGLALASVCGFALRWYWMMNARHTLHHPLTRTLPHILDTFLLATGVWLAFTIHQYPVTSAWLTAKLGGLAAYIVLGSLALGKAARRNRRVAAFVAAIAVFAWIVSVARLKTGWGFFSLEPWHLVTDGL